MCVQKFTVYRKKKQTKDNPLLSITDSHHRTGPPVTLQTCEVQVSVLILNADRKQTQRKIFKIRNLVITYMHVQFVAV